MLFYKLLLYTVVINYILYIHNNFVLLKLSIDINYIYLCVCICYC